MKNKQHDELTEQALLTLSKLKKLRNQCLRQLDKAPQGYIRVQIRKENPQYYLRTDPKDSVGKYVRKKNIGLVQRILQRDYDNSLLEKLEIQISSIETFLSKYNSRDLVETYETFSPHRKALIQPLIPTDELYVSNWLSEKYDAGPFNENDSEHYTSSGLRVRSKSEVIIAEALTYHNIPFRYEYPLKLDGAGVVHPDFMCLNVRTKKEYFWEHLGMMDNEKYASRNVSKFEKYEQNGFFPGINYILTLETSDHPINVQLVEKNIETYLI